MPTRPPSIVEHFHEPESRADFLSRFTGEETEVAKLRRIAQTPHGGLEPKSVGLLVTQGQTESTAEKEKLRRAHVSAFCSCPATLLWEELG